ncbi:MAG: hypothetical protein ABIT09_10285 [Croceibacterium sp.]
MIRRLAIFAGLAVALAACGSQRDLRPAMGSELPPPPFGRADRPTANELLAVSAQAAPVRSEELRRQSEERQDDPFDLPPEDRSAAKPAPKP